MAVRPPAKLGLDALRDYGMSALARRALSIGELRDRLRRRAEIAGDVELVLADFKANGYLDDSRLASSFATSRLENEGFGRMRVLHDLRARRVAGPVAENAVTETYREVDERALIDQYLARKFRNVNLKEHLADPRKLASAYRRLRMAGFSSGATVRALKHYSQHADELEGLEDAPESAE